jgi:histidinol phosphatase-like enzyme (inositol monophosphatase family)
MQELEVAMRVARAAGEIGLRYWGQGLTVESKLDLSPVTQADREAEALIARELEAAFPEDGLLGEEGARKEGARLWIIDPIDGTRDFIRGHTHWAVLIGLEGNGQVLAGVAYFPARDEMFWAARGEGAWMNGQRIRASSVERADQAVLCVNGLNAIEPDWALRMRPFWAVRSFGGCRDAVMVARGQADLWVDPNAMPWDVAALSIIAAEAGARFFDFEFRQTIRGGSAIICAPGLEAEARRLLRR